MAESNSYFIVHYLNDGKHDFNLYNLPTDIMLSLSNALKWEFQKRLSAETAPDFKKERAIQHQRHLEQCRLEGKDPKQQFIDFPV